MTFDIIDNIEVPATAVVRHRERGPFATAVNGLTVGQGFVFDDARLLKKVYPSVAPKRFPADTEGYSKKFKIWQVSEGKVGVKRLADVLTEKEVAEAGDAE